MGRVKPEAEDSVELRICRANNNRKIKKCAGRRVLSPVQALNCLTRKDNNKNVSAANIAIGHKFCC
jgi:hypothetical protein